jgi:hypothetical protein
MKPAPTVTDEAIDDYFTELFGPPPNPTTKEPEKRTACMACEQGGMLRAHAEYAICLNCAGDPRTAAARLDARQRRIEAVAAIAHDAYIAAEEALSGDERAKWDAFNRDKLRVGVAARNQHRISDETRRNVARMDMAYKQHDPRIAEALHTMYAAGERLYWANAEMAGLSARVTRAREELRRCLVALGVSDEEAA